MEYNLFYFFSAITLISAVYIIFFSGSGSDDYGIYFLIVSSCGILILFNAVYIAFLLILVSAAIFSFKLIRIYLNKSGKTVIETEYNKIRMLQIIILSCTFALCASLVSSTMWHNDLYYKAEINLAEFGHAFSVHFILFLTLSVSVYISVQFKKNADN